MTSVTLRMSFVGSSVSFIGTSAGSVARCGRLEGDRVGPLDQLLVAEDVALQAGPGRIGRRRLLLRRSCRRPRRGRRLRATTLPAQARPRAAAGRAPRKRRAIPAGHALIVQMSPVGAIRSWNPPGQLASACPRACRQCDAASPSDKAGAFTGPATPRRERPALGSLPFQLGIGGRGVAGVVSVEQLPLGPSRLAPAVLTASASGTPAAIALRRSAASVSRYRVSGFSARGHGALDGTVARHHALGRNRRELAASLRAIP